MTVPTAASPAGGEAPLHWEPDSEKGDARDAARAIFEAIADPIFVIDFVGENLGPNFSYVNEAACRLLQRSREELLTMRPGTVDKISDSVMEEAFAQIKTIGRATFESEMISSHGEHIPVEIHASDARLAGKRICVAVARSLAARKEMDARMKEAKEAAEDASRAKSDFLAMMSHEIRTPLHGVIGFASLLDDDTFPKRQQEAIRGIRESANLLLALVTDVLDFSRIEAGQMELQPRPVLLFRQIGRIAASFRLQAEKKGLEFHYIEAPEPGFPVLADLLRIEQVLGNLLNNALKFTESGSITLKVSSSPEGNTGAQKISLVISDTGIGIPQDQLSRLFRPFTQADSSPSRRYGGSGLGLVIVKKLCELMGGSASAQSTPGLGSAFTASLVVHACQESENTLSRKTESSEDNEPLRGLKILVAEDNLLNQRLMRRMLEKMGHQADFATSGQAVIEMASANFYPLIFMDVNMPGISGLEAAREIRSRERAEGSAPSRIVALTAGVSEHEQRACLDAGMDEFLGKPFTDDGLRAALKRARKFLT